MLGVVIKGFEKILKQKEGETMMQGTEGRWRQSRRRSKHEVPPPFFANLKTQSNSRYDSTSDFIGNFNCFYGSVLVICLHLNLGFWQ